MSWFTENIGSLAGGAMSGLFNLFGQKKAYQHDVNLANMQFGHNKAMAEWQNQKQMEFWHLNNQYNSPANQVNRMMQAGLNPALFYGQGTPGNATMMTSAGVSPYQRATGRNIMEGFNPAMSVSQLMSEKVQRAKIGKEITKMFYEMENIDINTKIQEVIYDAKSATIGMKAEDWKEKFGYEVDGEVDERGFVRLSMEKAQLLVKQVAEEQGMQNMAFKNAVERVKSIWADAGYIEGMAEKNVVMWIDGLRDNTIKKMAYLALLAAMLKK